MREIKKHITEISNLCSLNGVKALFAFGSVIKDSLKPGSDVDLVVAIDDQDPLKYSDCYFNLKFGLAAIFSRKIDLLEEKAIKNPYLKKEIDNNKVLIYAK